MQSAFEQSPVINSPFRKPERHYVLNEDGSPSGVIREGRRPSAYFVPIPPAKKKGKAKQAELALEGGGERITPNVFINEIRGHVERWRELPAAQWSVTHETARLLLHWRAGEPQPPLFFCQIEAIETLIWLTEVGPNQRPEIRKRLEEFNVEANPELFRLALKMATGSGKTTVMAMLIAWQAINFARRPGTKLFADAFLIVTPGITIKDRLRVLLPSDPQNYYETRNLIARDMLDDVRKARVIITNYHAFKLREKLQAPKLTKQILQGREQALSTIETEGEMIRRACPELMARKNIVVINDEAHHCYRHKIGEAEEQKVSADEREEAKKNEEAARVWISGLEVIKRNLGLRAVYDLSATPFFQRGSGYPEGTLFGWVVRLLAHGRDRVGDRQDPAGSGLGRPDRKPDARLPGRLQAHSQRPAEEGPCQAEAREHARPRPARARGARDPVPARGRLSSDAAVGTAEGGLHRGLAARHQPGRHPDPGGERGHRR